MTRKHDFWLLLVVTGLLLAASWGFSAALRYGWGRRFLLEKLSASFGRPVEASRFSLGLLGGAALEADAVTVAEDPRYGQEYFLRADQLTAKLDWPALLRGRIEFGTLAFSHPSLNLVRAADGHWNVESWLPPAPAPPNAGVAPAARLPLGAAPAESTKLVQTVGLLVLSPVAQRRLGHIVIDDGRINFKLGDEKILFALTAVSGRVDQDGAGRWNLDLEADPLRASVALQESGTMRLRGTVAGTSARLRPASLVLTWEDASLADALRLAGGQDYGVRGLIGAEIAARVEDSAAAEGSAPSRWRVDGRFHLAGIHRWDLTARSSDPGLNLIFSAAWQPGSAELAVDRCRLETAHSELEAMADAEWSHGLVPSVQVTGSRIDLGDVLAWTRAFRTGVPEDFSAEGAVELRTALSGRPLRITQTELAGTGAAVRLPGLGGPIRVGPLAATQRDGALLLAPLSVTLPAAASTAPSRVRGANSAVAAAAPASAGALRVEGSIGPLLVGVNPADWPYRVAVAGRTARVEDLLAMAQLLGHRIGANGKPDGWTARGSVGLQLAWAGTARHPGGPPTGSLDLRGVQISSAILNQPLVLSAATVAFRGGERHVKVAGAEALGASWKGTLDWDAADSLWRFDLSADRLDAPDLDRWLGPRARAGFFAWMLPFVALLEGGSVPAAGRDAAINRLAARGQLHVAEVLWDEASLDSPQFEKAEPLHFDKVEASVELKGRSLALRRAQAEFSEGQVLGELEAQLTPDPGYSFHGQFDRVNLAPLTASENEPEGRVAGVASGDFELAAHGVGRDALLASLAVQGDLRVRAPILRGSLPQGLDAVAATIGAADPRVSGETRFRAANATFRLARGVMHVDHFSLDGRDKTLEAQGSIDLAQRLDLRAWSVPRGAESTADLDPLAERVADRGFDRGSDRSPERTAVDRTVTDRPEWAIGGTLDAPLVIRQSALAGDVAASSPLVSPIPIDPARAAVFACARAPLSGTSAEFRIFLKTAR